VLTRFNTDGSLDTTFGNGGSLTSTLGSAAGVVVELDGRIIVAAATSLNSQANNAFVVAAYNPNGSAVATFGNGGVVTTTFGTVNYDVAKAIVLQPDGKFVVAGTTAAGQAYARYNEDGSLDPTFGTNGKATVSASGSDVTALAFPGDGKIVAAVTQTIPVSSTVSVFYSLTRLTPAGALDPAFGTQGSVNTVRPAKSVLVQTSGRIIVASTAGSYLADRFVLDGFTATGSPDSAFGTGGETITAIMGTVPATVNGVLVQPDGKIIVAGSSLVRYNPDGSLDTTFGTSGRVTPAISISLAVLRPDRKILVVGNGTVATGGIGLGLARYNADGSLDSAFGTGGTVIVNFSSPPDATWGRFLALQTDGKIVVFYFNRGGSPYATPGLIRFNSDGTQDTSFHATIPKLFPGSAIEYPIAGTSAVQPDGRILLSIATTDNFTQKAGLMRFNADGSLDPLFGNGGTIATSVSGTVRLQLDGRILLVGTNPSIPASSNFAMARYYANGNPDTTFGTGGQVQASFGPNRNPWDFVLQPDGKILVAGRAAGAVFALARFDPNGGIDTSFGTGGQVTDGLADTEPTVGPVYVALQPDGRIIAAGNATVGQIPSFGAARFLNDNPISDANQRFITHVYLDLLGRSPDASGLMTFTTALDQGQLTRLQVAQIITNSLEYHTLVVQGLYGRLLGRPADPTGLNNWVNFLSQGGTADQLEAIFLGSAEYFNGRGAGTANGFLQALYGDVLGRPIDTSGSQTWGNALTNGLSPATVATTVLASQEADQMKVEELYGQVLHRPADASGLNTYTAMLQQGQPETLLLAILASSDEYFARA
jgi:uncharacterized delta-60 repeat protein